MIKANIALALLVAAPLVVCQQADARPAKCLLQVDGRNYINRTCNFAPLGTDGSFTVGTDEHPVTFFAYLSKNTDGTMDANWNGAERAFHADDSLGTLRRDPNDPACWVNAKATVCAW